MATSEKESVEALELQRLEFDLLLTSLSAARHTPPPPAVNETDLGSVPPFSPARELISLIQEGRYLTALQPSSNKELFEAPADSSADSANSLTDSGDSSLSANRYYESLSGRISARVTTALHESKQKQFLLDTNTVADPKEEILRVLALGVAALYVFVQANLTG